MDPSLLLIIAIFLPVAGACVLSLLAPLGNTAVRWAALATTLATLVVAGMLMVQYPAEGSTEAQFVTDAVWLQMDPVEIHFNIGIDGLTVWLFGLSALLMVTAVLVSWNAIKENAPLFFGMLLLLETGCLGVFAARDIILFYVFFEFTLIPLFFLIGIWGSEDRQYAAAKFFIYTLAGSLLTFIGILSIAILNGQATGVLTFSIPELTASLAEHPLSTTAQVWIFIALFAGFAIKVPLFPLHTWLPLAHVQAPTAGSVFLAGILLKIGTYGFLRFSIPMLPDATAICMPAMLWLAVIGIVYGALVALAQTDIKRLIAYSSVSHLGFCMLGLFALNPLGIQGGALQMINHGISTGGLFAVVGMIYERYHTRDIAKLGGLASRTPVLAFFMLVFTFSSIGLPGLNGFAGEFLVLAGMFQRAFAWQSTDASVNWQFAMISVLAITGVVLGAWYMLKLVRAIFFGKLNEPHEPGDHHTVADCSFREIAALAPLAVFVLWIGLFPQFFLQRMQPSLNEARISAEARVNAIYQTPPTVADANSPATDE